MRSKQSSHSPLIGDKERTGSRDPCQLSSATAMGELPMTSDAMQPRPPTITQVGKVSESKLHRHAVNGRKSLPLFLLRKCRLSKMSPSKSKQDPPAVTATDSFEEPSCVIASIKTPYHGSFQYTVCSREEVSQQITTLDRRPGHTLF